MKRLLFYCYLLLALLSASAAFATAKTLPQGVWSFDIYHTATEVEKAAANPNGDLRTWHTVNIDEAVAGDVYSLRLAQAGINQFNAYVTNVLSMPQLAVDNFSLDEKLAEDWKVNKWHVDVAYGFTDQATFFVNAVYDQSVLDISDGYVAVTEKINAFYAARDALQNTNVADYYNIQPDEQRADHWRDIFIGMKYKWFDNFSTTLRATFGFLKVGKHQEEINFADRQADLTTGDKHDTYQLFLNYDHYLGNIPIQMMGGWIHRTKNGTQDFLDVIEPESLNFGAVDVHFGDSYIFGIGTQFDLNEQFNTGVNLTQIFSEPDRWKPDGTNWQRVPKSDVRATFLDWGLTYKPAIFMNLWTRVTIPLHQSLRGQVFDVPGRLAVGNNYQFGIRLFYK